MTMIGFGRARYWVPLLHQSFGTFPSVQKAKATMQRRLLCAVSSLPRYALEVGLGGSYNALSGGAKSQHLIGAAVGRLVEGRSELVDTRWISFQILRCSKLKKSEAFEGKASLLLLFGAM
jgi:hypothetical protein